MSDPSLLLLLAACVTGLVAGTVDSIAGGGGLITVPVLLSMGLPPVVALGTNRMQGCVGTLTASIRFAKGGGIHFRDMLWGIVFTVLGAALGTITVQILSSDFLYKIIPFIMLALLVYVIIAPRFKHLHGKPRLSQPKFYIIFGLVIGFYNGFFGPGTGSLWPVAFMILLGFDLKQATMHTKPLNFTGNIISLAVFALGGHVAYLIGLAMACGQVFGASLGARLVMTKGVALIRPIFITMVTLMTIDIFMKAYFKI